jgi:hypothetical protein
MIIKDVQTEKIASAYALQDGWSSFGNYRESRIELERKGFRLISLEELAKLHIAKGINVKYKEIRKKCKDVRYPDGTRVAKDFQNNGAYVQEGYLWLPGNEMYLIRTLPVPLDENRETKEDMVKGIVRNLNPEQIKECLKDSCCLNGCADYIHIEEMGKSDILKFAFGKKTLKDYVDLFLKTRNERYPCYGMHIRGPSRYADSRSEVPYAGPIFFGGIFNAKPSNLDCSIGSSYVGPYTPRFCRGIKYLNDEPPEES